MPLDSFRLELQTKVSSIEHNDQIKFTELWNVYLKIYLGFKVYAYYYCNIPLFFKIEFSMQNPIHLICNIYNFISIPKTSSIQLTLHILKEFRSVQLLLTDLLTRQQVYPQYFKQSFVELQEFIQKQVQCFGPKKFAKMLESISIVIMQYALSKLQNNKIEVCILVITLYQKFCQKYLTTSNRIMFLLIYALSHFKKGSITIAETYIVDCKKIWLQSSTWKKNTIITEDLYLLINLYQGILLYKKCQFSSSKCKFSSIINSISLRIKQQLKCHKRITFQTKCFFILAVYYLSENYLKTQQNDKFSYNITQCVEFAKKYYQEFQIFVDYYQRSYYYNARAIKLSRIENKIQRLKSLHLNHRQSSTTNHSPFLPSAQPPQQSSTKYNSTYNSKQNSPFFKLTYNQSQGWPSQGLDKTKPILVNVAQWKVNKSTETKDQSCKKANFRLRNRFVSKQSEDKLKIDRISRQIQNIYILQQKNDHTLKKKTLKVISSQIVKYQNTINLYQQNLLTLQLNRNDINHLYPIQSFHQHINLIQLQTTQIKQSIRQNIWNVVATLKPTHNLEKYIQSFKIAISYTQTNKFFLFLYNSTSFNTQMRFYSIIRRIKMKKQRKFLRIIYLNNIKHLLEVHQHKTSKEYFANVYQIESGIGYQQSLPISAYTYSNISILPFNYCFQIKDHRILQFSQYLKRLDDRLYNRIYLFYLRMKKRLLKRFKGLKYRKEKITIKFNKKDEDLNYVLFLCSMKTADNQYHHSIERVDNHRIFNKDYDFKISTNIVNDQGILSRRWLNDFIYKEFLNKKAQHLCKIIQIQSHFRRSLAKNVIAARKLNNPINVIVTVVNHCIYSLISKGMHKNFYIEDVKGQNSMFKIQQIDFTNLNFIQKIKESLNICYSFDQQLKVVKRYCQLRRITKKLVSKSKEVKLDVGNESAFKKCLCFSRISDQYLYRGKMIHGKMMYSVVVKDFQEFPRPYKLRVFTISNQNLYQVNFEQIIYKEEKIYLQKNINKIQRIIDIQQYKQANIKFNKAIKNTKPCSKSTIRSSQSFIASESQQLSKSRFKSRISIQRDSLLPQRRKRNSITFKMRHKTALKQKDIQLIKKWIQDSHDQNSHCSNESLSDNG